MVTPRTIRAPETQEDSVLDHLDDFQHKDFICVVVALHNTNQAEHGVIETAMQVIRNPQKAIDAARDAEKMGYEFIDNETGVRVYYFQIGQQYGKALFDLPEQGRWPIDYPVVFRRYKMNGEWREEWPNEMMAVMMGLH